jgi:hypothetical protein
MTPFEGVLLVHGYSSSSLIKFKSGSLYLITTLFATEPPGLGV